MPKLNTFCLVFLLLGPTYLVCAQNERDQALALYRSGSYKDAISSLQQVTKQNDQDAEALFYLGAAYFKLNKMDDGVKVFKKLVKIRPGSAQGYLGIAYFNLFKDQLAEAGNNARKALELDPKIAEGYYVLGEVSFRNGIYNGAYQNADKAIALDPTFAYPYFLKSQALTQSYVQTYAVVTKFPNEKVELLKEAAENLEKYLALEKDKKTIDQQQAILESLKFFVEYYSKTKPAVPAVYSKPLMIISKAQPSYTEEARYAQVRGVVRLLIEFSSDGKISHIMVLSGLGHGITQEAIKAAMKIRFEPAEQDGKPVSVVKAVEYNFSLY